MRHFRGLVEQEARAFLDRTQASPALAVLCGGSEVYQQAAMMGVPEKNWRSPLFDEILPAIAREMRPDCAYVENSPSGGTLPFHANAGVAHYYGVGAYRRPLEDARRAQVRFASECLGFANVPDRACVARDFGPAPLANPLWDARIPRDQGARQDFEQVRDHYVADLYGVDPQALRARDPAALSRSRPRRRGGGHGSDVRRMAPRRLADTRRCSSGSSRTSGRRRAGACSTGGVSRNRRGMR